MDVRPGYKQTEVGVIPRDWNVVPFGRLFAFTNGVNADKTAYGKGVRFINVLEPISYSHIYGPEIPGRVEISGSVASAYSVKLGDVVFNRTSETDSELGLAAVYVGDEQVVFGGFVIRGRPIDDTFDPKYSGYALRAKMIRSQIIPMGQGVVRANIGQQNLRRVLAAVPPKVEQRAIASALSDVDGLLAGLDRLIVKKRDLKQAVMQQLLTGKTRLAGFKGKWEVRSLGSLGTWKGGMTPSMQNPGYWEGGNFPWISSGDVKVSRMADSSEHVTSCAVRDGAAVVVPANSIILVTRSGILRKYLPVALTMRPMAINQDIKALIPDETVSPDFLLHALLGCGDEIRASCLKAGTTVESVEFSWLKACIIPVPPPDEQVALAAALSDMDAELAALEARRDKTRVLKQGMMQELLTGRTRLV